MKKISDNKDEYFNNQPEESKNDTGDKYATLVEIVNEVVDKLVEEDE